jgi:hypothetical protein
VTTSHHYGGQQPIEVPPKPSNPSFRQTDYGRYSFVVDIVVLASRFKPLDSPPRHQTSQLTDNLECQCRRHPPSPKAEFADSSGQCRAPRTTHTPRSNKAVTNTNPSKWDLHQKKTSNPIRIPLPTPLPGLTCDYPCPALDEASQRLVLQKPLIPRNPAAIMQARTSVSQLAHTVSIRAMRKRDGRDYPIDAHRVYFAASISVIKRLRCPGLDPGDRHSKKKEITTCAKGSGTMEIYTLPCRLWDSFMQMPFNQYILMCNRSQKAQELYLLRSACGNCCDSRTCVLSSVPEHHARNTRHKATSSSNRTG